MKVGGSNRDTSMVLIPVGALTFLITVVMGGPLETLALVERLLYDMFDAALMWLR